MSFIALYHTQLGPQRDWPLVYHSSLLIIILLLPLLLYYSSVCPGPSSVSGLGAGTVPRVLIGKWYDCNPASDPPFSFSESVPPPEADEITAPATRRTTIDSRRRRMCASTGQRRFIHISSDFHGWGGVGVRRATVSWAACCVLDGLHGERLCASFNTKPVY